MMFYSSFQGEKGVMCEGEGVDVWGDWGWHLRGGGEEVRGMDSVGMVQR